MEEILKQKTPEMAWDQQLNLNNASQDESSNTNWK